MVTIPKFEVYEFEFIGYIILLYTSKRDDVKWFMDAQFSPSGDLSSMCGSH